MAKKKAPELTEVEAAHQREKARWDKQKSLQRQLVADHGSSVIKRRSVQFLSASNLKVFGDKRGKPAGPAFLVPR